MFIVITTLISIDYAQIQNTYLQKTKEKTIRKTITMKRKKVVSLPRLINTTNKGWTFSTLLKLIIR